MRLSACSPPRNWRSTSATSGGCSQARRRASAEVATGPLTSAPNVFSRFATAIPQLARVFDDENPHTTQFQGFGIGRLFGHIHGRRPNFSAPARHVAAHSALLDAELPDDLEKRR